MTDFLVSVAASIAGVIVLGILSTMTRYVRTTKARGRVAQGDSRTAPIPARLVGVIPEYPGYWRAGEIALDDGTWRPRGPWGTAVSFAGATLPPEVVPHRGVLPAFASEDTVFALIDHRGTPFQVAVHPDEAEHALATIAEAMTAAPTPFGSATLRGLRNRVPLIAFILLVASLGWMTYVLLPLPGPSAAGEVADELALALIPLIFPLIMAGALALGAWDGSRTLRRVNEPTPSEIDH